MQLIKNDTIINRVRESERFRTPKNFVLKCLVFLAVFMVGSLIQSGILMADLMPKAMDYAYEMVELHGEVTDVQIEEYMNQLMAEEDFMPLMLFSTLVSTLITILFCRFVEKRRLSTMGFTGKKAVLQYVLGLGIGFVMFSLVVALSYGLGGLEANGYAGASVPWLALMFLGFGLQGASEEIIFRGYFMTTLMRHHKPWVAVLVNSVGFALAHAGNNGINLLAFVNLTLFGVMISLYMLRTGSLWGACAIHSIWNFVQGNFYGLPVSGLNPGGSVFTFSLADNMNWANGGDFGLEAGIPTTVVLLAATAIVLFVPFGRRAGAAAETGAQA